MLGSASHFIDEEPSQSRTFVLVSYDGCPNDLLATQFFEGITNLASVRMVQIADQVGIDAEFLFSLANV